MFLNLESIEDAKKLIRRSILTKEIILCWSEAESLAQMLENIRNSADMFEQYLDSSFKFHVEGFNRSIALAEQIQIINRFAFLPLKGKVELKSPDVVFVYYEEWRRQMEGGTPIRTFFGVHVGYGNRESMNLYNLKKREYLGTTSMDPELSLVMANMALVQDGSFVLDPFVGTGSVLIACAHFGAYTMGADIDGRQIRGKSKASTLVSTNHMKAFHHAQRESKMPPVNPARKEHKRQVELMKENDSKNAQANVAQYGLTGKVLDSVVCDMAHHPWRQNSFWDAIVCDPPYGIRAGAKKIGNLESPPLPNKNAHIKSNGEPKYPTTVPYEMDRVIVDLLAFSARFLTPGGRLVYWLPTITDEYEPQDIPSHPQLVLVANSVQEFGRWSRRLITMEKKIVDEDTNEFIDERKIPAHSFFRDRYFDRTSKLSERVWESQT